MLSVTELIWAFLIFICAYAIVNRICKCLEQCAAAKSFGQACGAVKDPNKVLEEMKREQSKNQASGQTGAEGSDSHV